MFITVSEKKEGERIAQALVTQKLAACVNIIPAVQSLFWWEGKLDRAGELLLMVKTRKTRIPQLIKLVKTLHSYSVPEIIALPIIAGNKDYLQWLGDSTRLPGKQP